MAKAVNQTAMDGIIGLRNVSMRRDGSTLSDDVHRGVMANVRDEWSEDTWQGVMNENFFFFSFCDDS